MRTVDLAPILALALALAAPVTIASASAEPVPAIAEFAPREVPVLAVESRAGDIFRTDAARGKLLILHVWATWCGPCRTELPTLDALAADKPDGVEIAAISVDKLGWMPIERLDAAQAARHLSIYHDRELTATRRLNVVGLPTTLILDRSGREIARVIGAADWSAPAMRQRLKAWAAR